MKKIGYILTFIFMGFGSLSQTMEENYALALDKLSCMMNQTCDLSFKKAVFIVEGTYFDNEMDEELFDFEIQKLVQLCNGFTKSRKLVYSAKDKEKVLKYAAIFGIMKDTIAVQLDSNTIGYHYPYSYDFEDIWGSESWSNMFVSKLIARKKGNCHSLPFLYKILAKEMGIEAHIAVAPNHFYIKLQSKKSGWYNTELTSGIFPIDAWLMASGYIHLDAVVNKLYMEALDDKQSIALCVIDLAKGYQKKNGTDNNFVLQCCDTALHYYPNYINALLLKSEILKKAFEAKMEAYGVKHPAEIFEVPEAKLLFDKMTSLYAKIHQLGYRKMPKEMYLKWLTSLQKEREKYENKNITNFNN